jgi:hypothetical protein
VNGTTDKNLVKRVNKYSLRKPFGACACIIFAAIHESIQLPPNRFTNCRSLRVCGAGTHFDPPAWTKQKNSRETGKF